MQKRLIKATFARADTAYAIDGLFVPTNGRKRKTLDVAPKKIGESLIGFTGKEQLGVDDQSILLSLTAQLGIGSEFIDASPTGEISKSLRNSMQLGAHSTEIIVSKEIRLRAVMLGAGYENIDDTSLAVRCLKRLRTTLMSQLDNTSKLDKQPIPLISMDINEETRRIYVAINPRLTNAVLKGQHIRISLNERRKLTSEVAKLLHFWLCAYIRPGGSLGRSGVMLNRLALHVWGPEHETAQGYVKSKRINLIRKALKEIEDATRDLYESGGWQVTLLTKESVKISRPKWQAEIQPEFQANCE